MRCSHRKRTLHGVFFLAVIDGLYDAFALGKELTAVGLAKVAGLTASVSRQVTEQLKAIGTRAPVYGTEKLPSIPMHRQCGEQLHPLCRAVPNPPHLLLAVNTLGVMIRYVKRTTFGALAAVFVAGVATLLLHFSRPSAIAAHEHTVLFMEEFSIALQTGDATNLLSRVCLPAAFTHRTAVEQTQFLQKTLADEVTADGVRILVAQGKAGLLLDVFPDEGMRWADAAGVRPEQCVAFRSSADGFERVLVLATNTAPWRIVRLDNVR